MPDYYNVIDNTHNSRSTKGLFHVCNVRRSDLQARQSEFFWWINWHSHLSPLLERGYRSATQHVTSQGFSFNDTVGWTTRMLWLNFCSYTAFKPGLTLGLNLTSLVAWWSEFLTTNHEVPGSMPRSGSFILGIKWKSQGFKPL